MAIVGGMRQEDIWDVDAAQRYETPSTGMFAPEVLGATVDRLAGLAGDGPLAEHPAEQVGRASRSYLVGQGGILQAEMPDITGRKIPVWPTK